MKGRPGCFYTIVEGDRFKALPSNSIWYNEASLWTYSGLNHADGHKGIMTRRIIDFGQLIDPESKQHVMLVLNQPINLPMFHNLYRSSISTICADGGYDRLKEWCTEHHVHITPDYVIGDMDSIDDPEKDEDGKPDIIKNPDQNTNDLEKCLEFIRDSLGLSSVLVVGGLGGRFDHELATLSSFYNYSTLQIFYFNNRSVITSLYGGSYEIRTGSIWSHCGFGPLQGAAIVSTSGFAYNVQEEVMSLGGLMSTSNQFKEQTATISTTNTLIFSIELAFD